MYLHGAGSRIIDTSNSLAAKRLKPAGAQRAANDPTLGPYDGRNDNVPAGAWGECPGVGHCSLGTATAVPYSG
jgi:hypothetical protein